MKPERRKRPPVPRNLTRRRLLTGSLATALTALAVSAAGLLVCLTALNVLNGLARLSGWLTTLLLGGGYDLLASVTGDAGEQ